MMSKLVKSEETVVRINEIELCYDTFGEVTNPAILLTMGLGAQVFMCLPEEYSNTRKRKTCSNLMC
jgi:hypothetical protein